MSWPILIVDDDPELRATLVDILNARGLRAHAVACGADALIAVRGASTRPAVILLDLAMPDMNGRAFLDQLATDPALAAIPVVAITGDEALGVAVRDDVLGVVPKPIDLPTLLELIRRATHPRPTGRPPRLRPPTGTKSGA